MTSIRTLTSVALALAALTPLRADVPPDLIHYQGVLRDAAGAPSTGSFDMVFRFFDAPVGGNEILMDRHLLVDGTHVVVTTGQFSVEIGSGEILDGSGPGDYTTLRETFRDHGDLWLDIQVATETLAPRLRLASAGYALSASTLDGREADEFIDTSGNAQTKAGQLNLLGAPLGEYQPALTAVGFIGAQISSILGPSVYLGNVDEGVSASGAGAGGGFYSYGGAGVKAYGTVRGGHFEDLDNPSSVDLADGEIGAYIRGQYTGAVVETPDSLSWVTLANGSHGVTAAGRDPEGAGSYSWAGMFDLRDATQESTSTAHLAYGETDPEANFNFAAGGLFQTGGSLGPYAQLAILDIPEFGSGTIAGGVFGGGLFGGYVELGANEVGGSVGIRAKGATPGTFTSDSSAGWVDVAKSSYKIQGPGSVAFVQNHPFEKDRVIVYNAPEGAEVATYARGSARLAGGEARIRLEETFAWVTNPDLGLTAHLTPRGEPIPLAVKSLSTKELVVRAPADAPPGLEFDYLVYGLRIGFEETSIVREKEREAHIPSLAEHRKLYAEHPELRRFNALERVKGERREMGFEAAPDLTASTSLRNAIHEYDPAVDGPIDLPGRGRSNHRLAGAAAAAPSSAPPADPRAPRLAPAPTRGNAPMDARSGGPTSRPGPQRTPMESPLPAVPAGVNGGTVLLPVGGPVEAGDVLVFDPEQPGRLRRGAAMAEPATVGIAAALEAGETEGDLVPVAVSGLVACKVDAGYGAIRAGDLLTTSPTAGHAMRALEPIPGTILGMAAETLESGTGVIRVLVMPR